jgi:uncharacterized membrane protein YdbT with pleckstrin-like domain
MFCPYCGKDAGDAKFCPNCGKPLTTQPAQPQQPVQQPMQAAQVKAKRVMTIRHNAAYFVPMVIVLLVMLPCLMIPDNSYRICLSIFCVIILVGFIFNYLTASLRFDGKTLSGKKGVIVKTVMYSPASKIQYCKLSKFLWTNKVTIKVSAESGTYSFSDMANAENFVRYVNDEISK